VEPAIGGLLMGLLAMAFPQSVSTGYGWVQMTMTGGYVGRILLLLVFVKILARSLTISSGGSGGVFGPNVYIGAMLGGRLAFVMDKGFCRARPPYRVLTEPWGNRDRTRTKEKVMTLSPRAGQPADPSMLTNIPRLMTAYYTRRPDPSVREQRVAFGTSGHRGSAFHSAFNEAHILAITQAICLYRQQQGIDGPLFLGIDTHALSESAVASALEALAANGVEVMIDEGGGYTPTPVISHAILTYNRGRASGLADGIVVTPSHNPPEDGGFKYNPPHGGPADTHVTGWIEAKANAFLENGLLGVKTIPFAKALRVSTTHRHDYLNAYISDLGNVIDMGAIRGAKISLGVDPLGGAGVHYWGPIAERSGLNLTVVNEAVDPTFRFMTVDWDGQIRMDPSSPYAMQRLIGLKDRFEIAFACDTDHDRHGIVTRSAGLLPPNHYLSVAIFYLFQHRPKWRKAAAVGKTVVSSQMIDRVTAKLRRRLYEAPVGFKWFVDGLLDGSLGFGGEESAGASFVRLDGSVWTTDKDGIVAALLAAEITARMGRDPGEIYRELTREFGEPVYDRVEAPATPEQKEMLERLSPQQVRLTDLAGEKIQTILTHAPGNGAPIGGLKVVAETGWFAARPSGTENIYKIYAESFRGADHLRRILEEAQTIVTDAFAVAQRRQP
jgi:phosphoglucomutase